MRSRLMLNSEDAASAQPARAGDLLKQQCLSPAAFDLMDDTSRPRVRECLTVS